MPSPHYMVEAKLILNTAPEDIPRAEEIRTVIKDIWDIRMAKLRTSMDAFIREGGSYAKLDHLTVMEINSVRPLLPHALDQLYRLQKVIIQSSCFLIIYIFSYLTEYNLIPSVKFNDVRFFYLFIFSLM